ncbi:MAG: M15 family metallopeptidase [Acidimicrobiales bacterium]
MGPTGATGGLDATWGAPPGVDDAVAPYRSSVGPVAEADLGASWRPGAPVGPDELRRVHVDHWGFDGAAHRGELVVHESVADDVVWAFGELYAARFPIERVEPIDRYGGDDDASMAANNTSAFNARRVAGTTTWSEHAFGTAIDLNPVQNPCVLADGSVVPERGRPWADRSRRAPGTIHPGGVVHRTFVGLGWSWGGDWADPKDHHHLSRTGR